MKSKPTDKFWEEFAAALREKDAVRPVGEGWFPLSKILAEVGKTAAYEALSRKKDRFERFRGYEIRDGKKVLTAWYRLKKPVKK